MASERLQIIIDAEWKGKGDVQQANRDLQNMDGAAKKSGGSMLNLAGKVAQFAQVAGAAAAGAGLAWKIIGQGAELELATQRFDNLTRSVGSTADAMLDDLSRASGGMMTNADMIASASQIISLGLADNQQDVVDLASLVSQLGWDMQQVIMTFANNSKMRLDALGLSVTDVEERAKRLEAQGYDTDKAFDLAVIQAGQAKLELLGSAANTSAGGMERLKNRIIDAKDGLLEFIAVRSGPAFTGLANYMDAVEQAQADMNEAVRKGIITQEEADTIVNLSARGHDQWQQKLRETRAELDRVNRSLETSTATATAYYVGMGRLAEAERAHTATVADMNYHQEEAYEGMISSTAVLEANENALNLSKAAYDRARDAAARFAEAQDAITRQQTQDFLTAVNDTTSTLTQTMSDYIVAAGGSATETGLWMVATGDLSKEQYNAAMNTLIMQESMKALAEQYANGEISLGDLQEAMDDLVAGSPYAAEAEIDTKDSEERMGRLQSMLDAFDGRHARASATVDTNTNGPSEKGDTNKGGTPPPSGATPPQGPALASGTGGWVTVPPGYPNDTYNARLSSGERFNVIPAGQSGNMGGNTISISFSGAIFQGTTQQQAAQIAQMTADRLGRL